MTAIGQPLSRVDAVRKVTGTATFAAEVDVANVVYAVIVGSSGATGSTAVDITAAKAAPGVLAVLTADNVPKLPAASKKASTLDRLIHVFQDTTVHFADCPVALVVADTIERAHHAVSLVTVTAKAGAAPAAELGTQLASAYAPKTAGPREPADTTRGNVEEGLAKASVKHEAVYTTPIENHHPMEMHATIAVWQGDDRLQLYDSTQGIFGVRNRIAQIFGIPKENVRVTNHFVGGGFGSKGSPWSHVALAALAAKVTGRAVKLMVTRPHMFSLTGHRPATSQKLVIGADAQGRFTAIQHDVISETSRIDEFAEPSALQTRFLYSCPNVTTSHRLVRLDIPTPTFTRAPGEATGTFALESAVDEVAFALKLDPLAIRLKNHSIKDEQNDKPYSSKELLACYTQGAERFGWGRRKLAPRSMREGRELVGYGVATAVYHALQQPAAARATRKGDGTFLVQSGTQDIGTGTYTIMTQIAADALGVTVDQVVFELGDTTLPETPVSGGSWTASSTGSAVKGACEALVAKMALEPSNQGEMFAEHKTTPDQENQGKHAMYSHGACFVEVRVDEDLGTVRVARVVGAYAAGKILNPKTATSQYYGGLVWGIGMALHEHVARDPRTGRVVTRDLADYHLPVNADVPAIDVIMVPEVDTVVNPLGVKGVGEIGITGVAGAIANAIFHATGKRVRDLPITLDKLLEESRA